jgi:queuine tRNA-ribosyltransferase
VKFDLLHTDDSSHARLGSLELPHGRVATPVFMPVGTQGAVKGVDMPTMEALGFNLILSNTYHLYLRPGGKLIRSAGGLHGFTTWPHNFLTDSGGFQIFSLSPLRKILPEGVRFQSHIDGSRHLLTPESVVDVQTDFNSDIQMALDVCTAPGITEKKALEALYTTTAWAKRAKIAWQQKREEGYQGALFGIIQGNFFENLRQRSAMELSELDFPGYALGGLSVGEEFSVFQHFLQFSAPLMPSAKPRYLMGIGTPEYILEAVENGIDMFDCVFPTRVARNGTFFTRNGRLVLKNERYKSDPRPIEPDSVIKEYSRAYLRHLFKAEEMLGPMLATRHNLGFLKQLMRDIHQSIRENRFASFKRQFLEEYQRGVDA